MNTTRVDLTQHCETCGHRPGQPMTYAPQGDLTRQRLAFICADCHTNA